MFCKFKESKALEELEVILAEACLEFQWQSYISKTEFASIFPKKCGFTFWAVAPR